MMTKYEENLLEAQNADKVIFYDYLVYVKRIHDNNMSKVKYNADFLAGLPNYYFLGLPIKELLKSYFSSGSCHLCAFALSLCFDEYELITCNLANYAEYFGCEDYEHTIILVRLNGKEKVIDTTFCLITDLETYKSIFAPNNIRVIKKEELERTSVYQFINSLKDNYIAPIYEQVELRKDETNLVEQKHQELLRYYDDLCLNYYNEENPHLTDFIRRCLNRTSGSVVHNSLRISLKYNKFDYPKVNLSSTDSNPFPFDDDSVQKK